jgi:tetratricopeptide (TPR) repeat protein
VTLNTRRAALAAVLLFSAHCASATPADEAKTLMGQGQYAEALKKLDQHLAKNPQDAEARFARGLALTKLNRTPEAMKVFTDLTRDYPQLPEPYNNLAVLYAQQGDYEKARDALEAALATHPSYATAHENLGDIYAALAGAAYNRALMLDQGNQTVRNKLNLIGQVEKPVNDVLAVRSTPARPTANAEAAATPAAAPSGEAADADTTAAVSNVLTAWSTAWSGKDMSTYFSAYGEDFTPEGGQSRAAWEQQRRERITKPTHIKVSVMNLVPVRTAADRVRVSFLQGYESDNFSDSVNKVLDLKQVNGAWKIIREYAR